MPTPQERKALAQLPYFQCPAWADLPTKHYRLDVYQGHAKVDSFDISDDKTFLFGRLQEVVDIQLVHPSLSRVHFAILHAPTMGSVFIMDMGSANKTLVNDQPLPVNQPTKLAVGDSIVPGFDANKYVLALPDDEMEASPAVEAASPEPAAATEDSPSTDLPDFSTAMKVLKFRVPGKGTAEDIALKAAIELTGAAVSKAKEPAGAGTQNITIKHAPRFHEAEELPAEQPAPSGPSKRRFHDTLEEWTSQGVADPEPAPPARSKRRFQEDVPNETLPSVADAGAPYVGEMD